MEKILQNISLLPYNTFGINVKARFFITVGTAEEAISIYSSSDFKNLKKLIIGGGSNILFLDEFDGLVIKNEIKGIEKIKEDENFVWIKVGAGEIWHEFVLHCIENNWAGIENLSLIPGCVGAAPMQNIGAYGVEVKEVIESVETIQIHTLKKCSFTNEECKFGYRESVFKNEEKNSHFITHVIFKLSKNPNFKITYGAITDELNKDPETPISIQKISNAVIRIRQSKLPDPKVIGNAGSFFKNPEISRTQSEDLKKQFPELVTYPVTDDKVKVAAGWLIEKSGWKGFTEKSFGVHKLQALVLVNYGGSSGKEIYDLSEKIINDVLQKFGIKLEREVNIV